MFEQKTMPSTKHRNPLTAQRRAIGATQPTTATPFLLSENAALLDQIRQSRAQADRRAAILKRNTALMTYGSVTCSTLATLISGLAATMGPALGEGAPAWKITCGVVALFTASASFLGGIQQGARLSERLAKMLQCLGKLGALEIALTVSKRSTAEVANEYEQLIAQFQELVL